MELANGIAHVSFPGGGIFLPARDPYDRQTLIEHVTQRLRTKGRVQVLVGSSRWTVRFNTATTRAACAACGQTPDALCCTSDGSDTAYCVPCALGGSPELQRMHREEWRQVG